MKPIPFNSHKDLPPILFDKKICQLAREIKQLGLSWQPHAGCFVWDPDKYIKADSPFPHRIFFILSLPRFIEIFGSIEVMAEELVWLPTWHQARLLCQQVGVPAKAVDNIWQGRIPLLIGEELQKIYELIIDALKK